PRRLRTLSPHDVEQSLRALRGDIGGLISAGPNTTENLSARQKNDLPAQASSFLLGPVAGGAEPIGMLVLPRAHAGDRRQLGEAEIAAFDKKAEVRQRKQRRKKRAARDPNAPVTAATHNWHSPNFSLAFSNVEIRYRKIGETTVRVHRHIGWNLGNGYLE